MKKNYTKAELLEKLNKFTGELRLVEIIQGQSGQAEPYWVSPDFELFGIEAYDYALDVGYEIWSGSKDELFHQRNNVPRLFNYDLTLGELFMLFA